MVHLDIVFVLAWALFVPITCSKKTYGDMFPHKHKFPFPFPIPGWHPDTNPWNENLYPPFKQELTHRHDNPPRVRLTSDSPAMNGSSISFTAALEFPPCQKLDANGNLVYDEHCDDANGQVHSEYALNWTSWLDDYGFGKCTNLKMCNVFPDGKPFPQTSDWKRRGYVYVWHTMGQYFETCDGSSSHLTLNTTNMTFGAGVMEVMVYRTRRRKYSPLSADSTVFFITDKIPLSVNISQKEAANITDKNVFVRGSDVIFKVHLHDPSNYLKTADAVDFIWDFRDGNHLVTHSNVATHAYNTLGKVSVKLLVEAAFRIPCPPPTPTPKYLTQVHTTAIPTLPPVTQVITSQMETTKAKVITNPSLTTTPHVPTSAVPTTEPFQTDAEVTSNNTATPIPETSSAFDQPTSPPMIKHRHFKDSDCFRYMYGSFENEIIIIEPPPTLYNPPPNQILKVSAAKVSNTSVNFVVTCLGSVPSMACTIVSDSTCQEIQNIICEDVAPIGKGCKIGLKRSFQTPGTYCINITLGVPGGLALATTTSVTIEDSPNKNTPKSSHVAKVVLSSSAVLISIFAFIAFMVYKRHKVYRPVRCFMLDAERNAGVGSLSKLRAALFPANEERSRLLTEAIID